MIGYVLMLTGFYLTFLPLIKGSLFYHVLLAKNGHNGPIVSLRFFFCIFLGYYTCYKNSRFDHADACVL